MSRNPIARVLSTLLEHEVAFLLMGGQACIGYGAAEFSRDLDVVVLGARPNLAALEKALSALEAELVYVPPLSAQVLERGHACHFRCQAEGLGGLRLDVMARLRGVDAFPGLWLRRNELNVPGVGLVPLLSVEDLVKAKKTQRDKDWPMIRRLVEADVYRAGPQVSTEKVSFWLSEGRTCELLLELARRFPEEARAVAGRRPAIEAAVRGDATAVARLLLEEQESERELDRRYWEPLKQELERWRHAGRTSVSRPRD
ncbi:MAG: hypothetical protein HY814_08405 [Candidatus Riflebacteria bacterium]|nr:hypothetical protein [Candidatus Riflebacteria bacterium]